jgi:ubiquinone biosynthesis protein
VEHELGGPIGDYFADFETTPLAAASLGQVHRATLPTGQKVAVKVQRPGIDQIVAADLEALHYIVTWLDRHTPIRKRANLPLILLEFEETLGMELNYVREGHHAERFAVAFADVEEVRVPRVYWSHTTRKVLTMQYMWGIKVTDFERLESEGISRARIAQILMRVYLQQVLQIGFFHSDPHPGNIFVRPGPVVVFLDFGMVGTISPYVRENISRVFLGIIRRDFDSVLAALDRLGFFTRGADMRALRRALIWTVDNFYQMSFGELRNIDPREVLDQVQDVFYTQSVQIPANFAFLGRALGTLSGLCTALDPSFQFVSVAEPFGRGLLRSRGGLSGTVEQVAGEARAMAKTAYALPHLTRDVLQRVQAGELDFRRELEEMGRGITRLERAMRRILYGVLVSAFLVGGSFIFDRGHVPLSLGAFAIAMVFLVMMMVPYRRGR